MNKFCILPYIHLQVRNRGEYAMCCYATQPIQDGGQDMMFDDHTAEKAFNSQVMREARKQLADGVEYPACRICFDSENRTGGSYRRWANNTFAKDLTKNVDREKFVAGARENDFRVEYKPRFLQLILGNLCNLKCRMCWAHNSSEIARDPVHGKWANAAQVRKIDDIESGKALTAERMKAVDSILGDPSELEELYLTGGEPLLMASTVHILEKLLAAGLERTIRLRFNTNGTIAKGRVYGLLKQFSHVKLNVSCDGVGSVYEYIRYPAKWEKVGDNIQKYADDFGPESVGISLLVQAYNLFSLGQVRDYFDALSIPVHVTTLRAPYQLSIERLPENIRLSVAEDLEAGDIFPQVSKMLRSAKANASPSHVEALMTFTNDLDASRGQSVQAAVPELISGLSAAGYPWQNSHRHWPVLAGAN